MLYKQFPKLFKKDGSLRRIGWDRTTKSGWVKRNFSQLADAQNEKVRYENARVFCGIVAVITIPLHDSAYVTYKVGGGTVDFMDLCEMVHVDNLEFRVTVIANNVTITDEQEGGDN